MVLATININGNPTKVLMHADRNGFFYVLDRTNGKLLAANPFVKVNWASGIDMKTGRPIETDVTAKAAPARRLMVWPSLLGGMNWSRCRFNPQNRARVRQHAQFRRSLQGGRRRTTRPANFTSALTSSIFSNGPHGPRGYLKAIDPLTGKTKWENSNRHSAFLRGFVDGWRSCLLRSA